jgi:hypothetical protein
VTASCPGVKLPIGRGFFVDSPIDGNREPPFVTESRPVESYWSVTATFGSIIRDFTVTAYAICMNP